MSDNLMITLEAALQQLAQQHTEETLGDRATYLGASDIASCPRKTILSKLTPQEFDIVTLLRFRRGHMAEDIVYARHGRELMGLKSPVSVPCNVVKRNINY